MRLDAAQTDAISAAKIDHCHWTGHKRYDEWQNRSTGMIVNRALRAHRVGDAALVFLSDKLNFCAGTWHIRERRVTALKIVSAKAMSTPPYAVRCPE